MVTWSSQSFAVTVVLNLSNAKDCYGDSAAGQILEKVPALKAPV